MAVAIVVTFIVFPETMNHSCLSSTSAQLGQIKALIAIQSTILESNPDDLAPDAPIRTKVLGMRRAVLIGQKACKLHLQISCSIAYVHIVMAKSGFINLEFSWGRWNGDDVRSLEEPLMALVTRAGKDGSISLSNPCKCL